jgi:hypothetical protein
MFIKHFSGGVLIKKIFEYLSWRQRAKWTRRW